MSGQQPETNVGLKLLAYWLLVGIPLLWGVSQTIANAMKMFR